MYYQAVGRCSLDGYNVQGDVWRSPDSTKATASGTCMHPTNQPLHQGAGEAGKARSESSTPSEATNLHIGSQGRGFDSRRRRPPFVVNPALILYPAWYGAYSVTCWKPIHCKKCVRFYWWIDELAVWSFHFRNIAGWQKRRAIFKKAYFSCFDFFQLRVNLAVL